jgi:excisionase family DNA binding protein
MLAKSLCQAVDVVTFAEVARALRVSIRTASKLVISGRLKSFQIGRCRRISRRALNDFIREGEGKAVTAGL